MEKITSFLKNQDLFEYKVMLNLMGKTAKNGSGIHQTIPGGVCSIILKLAFVCFICERVVAF